MSAQIAPDAPPSPEWVIKQLLYHADALMFGPARKDIELAVATIRRLEVEVTELRAVLRQEKFQDEALDPQGEPEGSTE